MTTPPPTLQLIDQLVQSSTSESPDEVLSIDDAHLLDELSAFVIHHVALRGTARLIVTVRSGEPAPDAVTALWKDGMLLRLDLQPLSRSESDALLASVLGSPVDEKSASKIWDLTRGNALYLRHLVSQEVTSGRLRECHGLWFWQEEFTVSDSIADLLGEQIRRLPEAVRTVLDLVAVAEPLPVAVLSELSDLDAVEEAENRGLIRIDAASRPRAARMAHPLYGEVRRARAGDTRLRRLRGRVVSALAALPRPDPRTSYGGRSCTLTRTCRSTPTCSCAPLGARWRCWICPSARGWHMRVPSPEAGPKPTSVVLTPSCC
ncbi:hypothetical protein ACFQZK_11675 [Rhodococcus aetherivorans]